MPFDLEAEIRKWRDHVRGTGSVGAGDLEELETHLRDGVDELSGCGLDGEEALLISVRRLGNITAVGEEFAKVTSENLWRQMVVAPSSPEDRRRHARELGIVVILGLLAGESFAQHMRDGLDVVLVLDQGADTQRAGSFPLDPLLVSGGGFLIDHFGRMAGDVNERRVELRQVLDQPDQ